MCYLLTYLLTYLPERTYFTTVATASHYYYYYYYYTIYKAPSVEKDESFQR